MWEALKNLATTAKDALGIELPTELPLELPTDLVALGDTATTAVQAVAESAGGVGESLSTAAEEATAAVSETSEVAGGVVAPVVDALTQVVPDLGGAVGDAIPSR